MNIYPLFIHYPDRDKPHKIADVKYDGHSNVVSVIPVDDDSIAMWLDSAVKNYWLQIAEPNDDVFLESLEVVMYCLKKKWNEA